MQGTEGDARVAKPSFIISVPILLDNIVLGVTKKVEEQSFIKRCIFNSAIKYKTEHECSPFVTYLMKQLIFNQVQEEFGGKLKVIGSGAAPLTAKTHKAIRAMFDVPVQVGYGTTETAASVTCMDDDDTDTGHTGGPNMGVLVRLINWEEGDYMITDEPNPRGEVIVAGPVIAKQYFNLTKENEYAFFEEHGQRWFCTGDIGEIDPLGRLKIIDRKKDLIKLKHGEFISLGKIESRLKSLACVENICVIADPAKGQTVAVVVPSHESLRKVAGHVGIDESASITIEELCNDWLVKEAFLEGLVNQGKELKLTRWELPSAIHLIPDPWTPDTGLVTATLKLKRKRIRQHYNDLIVNMYSRIE
ncbi:hypothetical protein Pcinc_020502 [Petrolisthes cinctipes]|uniref:long-chain-fatty-acid--CoA ligase n=1 Tax=Petrolisthes cinctipes TaxID=88211 RepID=A0AAE1FI82_PETCI|nr:hypothetical protein Pcinc_020502 [Petrolisthes cinctipes]